MAASLDHTIVRVKDLEQTVAFWTHHLGLRSEGTDGPFAVVRVSPSLTIQFAPWGTEGGEIRTYADDPNP
ncbi:MAG: VOC family protein [Myxococcota bacterium]